MKSNDTLYLSSKLRCIFVTFDIFAQNETGRFFSIVELF